MPTHSNANLQAFSYPARLSITDSFVLLQESRIEFSTNGKDN